MNKLRHFLIKKLTPKNGATIVIPAEAIYKDGTNWGRYYIQMDESLRLYFEDGKYVGFSTGLPYIGKSKEETEESGVG